MHFRERSRQELLVLGSRHSRRSKRCAAWLICQAGSGSAPRLRRCRGARAAPRPGAPGWPRVTHPAPRPPRAPRLPGVKTNRLKPPTTNPQESRREGGREREPAVLPPTPPAGTGTGSLRGAAARPPPGLPLPGKAARGPPGSEGRHAALPAGVGEDGGWPGASRLPGSGFFPLERKAAGNAERCVSLGFDCAAVSAACCQLSGQSRRSKCSRDPMGPLGKETRVPHSQDRSTTRGLARGSRCWCCPTEPLPVAAHLSRGRARDRGARACLPPCDPGKPVISRPRSR